MAEEQFPQVFWEIHSGLPWEGPGDTESTTGAFSMLPALPEKLNILDIGCGPGMQTLDLLTLSNASIVAVDFHQPFLYQLRERARQECVINRVNMVKANMSSLCFKEASFDLIWAEGSAYIMGFENAFHVWKPLLKGTGYLAVTELSWIKPNPPQEVLRFFTEEYPEMQDVDGNLQIIQRAGYQTIEHFILPKSSWWDNYYKPIIDKLPALTEKYRHDPEALAMVELHEKEIDIYRRYSDYYGYVFYITQVG